MNKKIVILLAIGIMLFVPISSSKASTKDSAYSFSLNSSVGYYSFTEFRLKGNKTSVYLKPATMTNTLTKVYVKIYGSQNNAGTAKKNCTYKNRNYYYTRTDLGKEFEVYNTVGEDITVSHASLALRASQGSGTTSGVWSPDTAGHFPQLQY